jgi:hypothetical protein
MAFTMEKMIEVWNDEDGSVIEVGPDRDSLGLVEIRMKDEAGKIERRLTMHPERAKLVAHALLEISG